MRIRPSVATLAAVTTTLLAATNGQSFAHAHPLPDQQRQALFGPHRTNVLDSVQQPPADMSVPYMFDSGAKGPPELSDVLPREKGASIAMNAILESEELVRAISGDSGDFAQGLTLLLPTNKAFQALDDIPDDIGLVMKRHFVPQIVTPQAMEHGATVFSYQRSATLRFTSSQGKVFVQADKRAPTAVHGTGVQAGSGTYFLVDELFA
ncbi:hypothetical protein LPJ59_003298 [Coemansia sp. RSA 2399]|nr:hypothetical protein LPJ59_003298 [Coemansia sp. RSA 2399]KAJ1903828.1 hypothetical protein LPJ81_002851 [Coemansia sp. IMI 209127]